MQNQTLVLLCHLLGIDMGGGGKGWFFSNEKERRARENMQTSARSDLFKISFSTSFCWHLLLPPVQLAMPSSFSFPACSAFAADDNLWPEYFLSPDRPGYVEGQKIYKPALSSHINQQIFLPVCEPHGVAKASWSKRCYREPSPAG